jgi:hypothetical protein
MLGKDAYSKGYRAYQNGVGHLGNPYLNKRRSYTNMRLWASGWGDAQVEATTREWKKNNEKRKK